MDFDRLANSLINTNYLNPDCFNPYKDKCFFDTPYNTSDAKLARLREHFSIDAEFLMVGEAPGYQGARFTGLPFTSEFLLLQNSIPRQSLKYRLTHTDSPMKEPASKMVWETLYQLGIENKTILWNAFPFHPFVQGKALSNRTPDKEELCHGASILDLVVSGFPEAKIIAVGNSASMTLSILGYREHFKVRHPSNGGKHQFQSGVRDIVEI